MKRNGSSVHEQLSVSAVAGLMKICVQTVRTWADAGTLQCVKDDKGRRSFDRAYIEELARPARVGRANVQAVTAAARRNSSAAA